MRSDDWLWRQRPAEPQVPSVAVGGTLAMLAVALLIFGLSCWLVYSYADRADWTDAHPYAAEGGR
jgi:hypothetical protein